MPAPVASAAGRGRDWRVPFWMCGGDLCICCCGYCLPCLVYAQNNRDVDPSSHFWRDTAAFCCLPFCVQMACGAMLSCVPAVQTSAAAGCVHCLAGMASLMWLGAPRRAQLRARDGLDEAPCSDSLAWFLCSCLALCQEAGHIQRRRMEEGAGSAMYHSWSATRPPKEQVMPDV